MDNVATKIARQGVICTVDKCAEVIGGTWMNSWTGISVAVDFSWQLKDHNPTNHLASPGVCLVGCVNESSGFKLLGITNLWIFQVLDGSGNVTSGVMTTNQQSDRNHYNRNAGMTICYTWDGSADEMKGYTFDTGFQAGGMSTTTTDVSATGPANWGTPYSRGLGIGGLINDDGDVINDSPNDCVIHKVSIWKNTILTQANFQAYTNNIDYGASRLHTNWSHRSLTYTEAGITQPTHLWDFENANLADGDQQDIPDTGSASADGRTCKLSTRGVFLGRRKVYT